MNWEPSNIAHIPPVQVQIADIDLSMGPYCMSFGDDIAPLALSIENIGLLNTPLLIRHSNEKFDIISGYRRVRALQSLKWPEIPCRVLSESQFSPLGCLLLNLYDNLATRRFNEVEKAMILTRLNQWLPRGEIIRCYMKWLDLPAHEPTLLFYMRIEQAFNTAIKEHLAQARLSLKAAKTLLEVSRHAREAIFEFAAKLKLNINQFDQAIEYLVDIYHMDSEDFFDLLGSKSLIDLCSNLTLNGPQQIKAVFGVLRAKRYPYLNKAQQAFKDMVSGLALPDGVNIIAPHNFEGPRYRLEIRFKDGRQLMEIIRCLSKKEGMEGLGDPWKRAG